MKALKETLAALFWLVLIIVVSVSGIAEISMWAKGPYSVEYESGKHKWVRHMAYTHMFVTHHPDCPCNK